jgi:phosphoesterase RecJ-like protein
MKISSKLLNLAKNNRSFLIAGHINPEADSIGSSLALAQGLKKLGKKDVCVLSKDPVPEILRFLPSAQSVKHKMPKKEFDVLFIVDCNVPDRTGFSSFNARKIGIIDHHVLPSNMSKSGFHRSVEASLIVPEAAAAGELIYRFLTALKVNIDRNMATNLYAALLVDTGGFRYSNTTVDALEIASQLVKAGARPWKIAKEIYESVPFNAMKLLGHSLSTLEKKDGIAWITTSGSMFKKTGTTAEDSEDFVNFPRKVNDIEIALFFREDKRNSYKVSLRSKGKVDVQKIAKTFGGGGHAPAAGCKVKGSLKEVQRKVLAAARKAIKDCNG